MHVGSAFPRPVGSHRRHSGRVAGFVSRRRGAPRQAPHDDETVPGSPSRAVVPAPSAMCPPLSDRAEHVAAARPGTRSSIACPAAVPALTPKDQRIEHTAVARRVRLRRRRQPGASGTPRSARAAHRMSNASRLDAGNPMPKSLREVSVAASTLGKSAAPAAASGSTIAKAARTSRTQNTPYAIRSRHGSRLVPALEGASQP